MELPSNGRQHRSSLRRGRLLPNLCLLVGLLWLLWTGLRVLRWAPGDPTEFDVADFGAVGDGVAVNTGAFERAVKAIETAGGGTLRVGRGIWLTGPFNLTSHMTLFLAEGAAILGVTDERKWTLMPPLPSYGVGREHDGPRYGSLIHGQYLKNVVITGHNGTIDGQGEVWWTKFKEKQLNYTRGPLVQFMWSEDIVISNVTLQNSPFWTLHPYVCNNVTVSNVTILAPVLAAPNTDGIDPDSCDNVVIENCYIHVGDDGISIKSGWDQYGIRYGRPSTNIIIRNVIVRTVVSAGISIGSEMSGGVSNVLVENFRVQDSRGALKIKTAPGRGGYIRNITYRNITIDDVRFGIIVKADYNQHADEGFDPAAIPLIENITFTRVYGRKVRMPVQIRGSKEIPIRNVTFSDIAVQLHRKKEHPFQCAYVEGRVIGSIYPAPCVNLDLYTADERLVKRSKSQNASNIVAADLRGA